jgi:hypothetical protein
MPHGEGVRVVVDLAIEMEQGFLPSGAGTRSPRRADLHGYLPDHGHVLR